VAVSPSSSSSKADPIKKCIFWFCEFSQKVEKYCPRMKSNFIFEEENFGKHSFDLKVNIYD
jgi:hypothetical protein